MAAEKEPSSQQFGISPEKIEALRNRHLEDQKKARPDVFDKLKKLAAGEEAGILGKNTIGHYLAEHARHETIKLNIDREFVRRAFHKLRDTVIESGHPDHTEEDEENRFMPKTISLNIDGSDCLIEYDQDKDSVAINIFVSSEKPEKPIEEVDYITLKSDGAAWTGRNVLDDMPRTVEEFERKREMVKKLPTDFFENFIALVLKEVARV